VFCDSGHSKEPTSTGTPNSRFQSARPRAYDLLHAYFSDRGRLFHSEGGRRFSVIADGVSI